MSSFNRVNSSILTNTLRAPARTATLGWPIQAAHGGPENWGGRGRTAMMPWWDGNLWPRSRFCGGDPAGTAMFLTEDASRTGCWAMIEEEGGTQSMLAIKGFCYASDGTTPISGVTVQIFVTATDTFLRDCVSAVDGAYEARTQMPAGTQHYLVAYKAGSPDVAGTTVNTLVGA